MRAVRIWAWAILFIGIITIAWWITIPLVLTILNSIESNLSIPNAQNIASAVRLVTYIWGPIINIFILAWAFMSMSAKDVESEIYE